MDIYKKRIKNKKKSKNGTFSIIFSKKKEMKG